MQTATTTCNDIGSSTICTIETAQYFISGFSFGEVLIILILLMFFSAFFFNALKTWIFGVKIEKADKALDVYSSYVSRLKK